MAESWVRLWAGMTTDPKWQTIARKSGQPRALVIAVFTHLMLEANEAEDRGALDALNIEDAASALDCDEEAVEAILAAMRGRVIEDGKLSGWDRRQPRREDAPNPATGAKTAAERKREQRAREAASSRGVTPCHAVSRGVTRCHAPEAEAEAEVNQTQTGSVVANSVDGGADEKPAATLPAEPFPSSIAEPEPTRKGIVCRLLRQAGVSDAAPHHLTEENWTEILGKRTDEEIVEFARAKLESRQGQRTGLKYLAPGLLENPAPITGPPGARASPGKPSRHSGFENLDYRAGVNPDGTF